MPFFKVVEEDCDGVGIGTGHGTCLFFFLLMAIL